MKVINPFFIVETSTRPNDILSAIESAGRTSYKSEDKITKDSAIEFVDMVVKREHLSVIEHQSMTVRFVCDRGVSHEIVRHRLASYTQESTRYCNYTNGRFGKELTFIKPCFWDAEEHQFQYKMWLIAMEQAERMYFDLIASGASPQEARSVLPNSLKTEIVMTANLREWQHFLKLRTASAAHPQMRQLTIPLSEEFKKRVPIIFDKI
jgi:thymidylate synthase (FAD)